MVWDVTQVGSNAQANSHGKALRSGSIGRGGYTLPIYRDVALTSVRIGNIVTITADSILTGTVYYYWYFDGTFMGMTTSNTYSVYVELNEQINVVVKDSNSALFDAVSNAPTDYPARRTIYWNPPDASDIYYYRVEQNRASAGWTTIGIIYHQARDWEYYLYTPRLSDLISYQWRIYPVDTALNDGTVITLDAETIVRKPDAVDYTHTFDEDTTKVTYTSA